MSIHHLKLKMRLQIGDKLVQASQPTTHKKASQSLFFSFFFQKKNTINPDATCRA
jgi:hypothetical protein